MPCQVHATCIRCYNCGINVNPEVFAKCPECKFSIQNQINAIDAIERNTTHVGEADNHNEDEHDHEDGDEDGDDDDDDEVNVALDVGNDTKEPEQPRGNNNVYVELPNATYHQQFAEEYEQHQIQWIIEQHWHNSQR